MVAGIPYIPAEAKALPREGASVLMLSVQGCLHVAYAGSHVIFHSC